VSCVKETIQLCSGKQTGRTCTCELYKRTDRVQTCVE
jgi:hypothetical protein